MAGRHNHVSSAMEQQSHCIPTSAQENGDNSALVEWHQLEATRKGSPCHCVVNIAPREGVSYGCSDLFFRSSNPVQMIHWRVGGILRLLRLVRLVCQLTGAPAKGIKTVVDGACCISVRGSCCERGDHLLPPPAARQGLASVICELSVHGCDGARREATTNSYLSATD